MSEIPEEWTGKNVVRTLLRTTGLINKMLTSKRAFYSEDVRQNAKRAFDSFIEEMRKLDPIFDPLDAVELDIEPPTDEAYPGEAHPDGQPGENKMQKEIDEVRALVTKFTQSQSQVSRAGVRVQEPVAQNVQPEIKKSATHSDIYLDVLKNWADNSEQPQFAAFATSELAKRNLQEGIK